YYEATGGALSGHAISSELDLLEAQAQFLAKGPGAMREAQAVGKLHHDLLRFQSALANSSSDRRSGSDQRDCGSLGSVRLVGMRGLVSRSSGLRTGHWSVHTDSCRASYAA